MSASIAGVPRVHAPGRRTRGAIWAGVALLALAVITGAWFVTNFERQSYEARGPAQDAARRDPWLPAEMLLARLGYHPSVAQAAAMLDTLPPGGTLILSSERQYHLTPARTRALFAWVEQGGHLIADAQSVGPGDPILRELDVRLAPPKATPPSQANARRTDDDEQPLAQQRRATARADKPRTVEIPGYARPLRMRASTWLPLYVGNVQPAWRTAGDVDRFGNATSEILSFDRGRGHVTLVNGLWRFHSVGALGEYDHAEILAALVRTHQGAGEVRILARLDSPSLFGWLAAHASAALWSAAALIILWLARVVPRFGAVRIDPAPERRSLIQHLRAVGRFLAREHASGVLIDAARAHVRRLAVHRGLVAPDAPAATVAGALARVFGIEVAVVTRAFADPTATPQRFTEAVSTLSDLERRLNDARTR